MHYYHAFIDIFFGSFILNVYHPANQVAISLFISPEAREQTYFVANPALDSEVSRKCTSRYPYFGMALNTVERPWRQDNVG